MLPAVAHLVGQYLGFTETFLDRQFRAHRRYAPWIYAERATALARFPTTRLATLPPGPAAALWSALLSAHWNPWFLPLMRRRGTRVVHAHYGPTAVKALPFVWREGWPLVASFYGYDVAYLHHLRRHPGHWRYGTCLPLLFRFAGRLLVLSATMRDELLALGAPPARVEIHRNGVDLDRFRPAPPGAAPAEPAVLLCGWEVEKKGFAYGFEALARLRRRGRRFRVLFHTATPGPLHDALERTIATLALGDVVERVPPEVPPDEVMARASLILAPSVVAADGDREGVPTVLVEAAASGLPAVASRHAGIPEIVLDGQTGLLCPERDVGALAEALERLLDDPGLRRRFGEAARAHAAAGWDAARLAERREEIYDEVRADVRT